MEGYEKRIFFIIGIVGGGVHTGSTRHCGHYWPIVPVPGDCEDGEVGGMKYGWQGKPKYSEKTCPGPILSTTNPTCQTRAAAVGSQRLTDSAMVRPTRNVIIFCFRIPTFETYGHIGE
jgi:hypothetical protein